MALRSLTAADLPVVERWFCDPDTRRWLGDEAWPRRLLALAGRSQGRFAFVAVLGGDVVGLADVERYGDDRAAVAVVVAPEHRRRGMGKAILRGLLDVPQLEGVVELFGGVEVGNAASAALVTSSGFEQVSERPDDEGFTYFAQRRTGSTLGPAATRRSAGRRFERPE